MSESPKTNIEIDDESGFCFGVVTAIKKAEEALEESSPLYCLGDIVHNSDEVERLRSKGLITISHKDLDSLHNIKLLLRAHGEPPTTYRKAHERNIDIVDATCPVVLQLQRRIKQSYDRYGDSRCIVIFGKQGHAEVNGLVGQTEGKAIVISSVDDLDKLDFTRDLEIYSQTTMSVDEFARITDEISRRIAPGVSFNSYDTICRQVANRVDKLRRFAASHSLILFVCGLKSSNGHFLFEECRRVNPDTHLVPNADSIKEEWLHNVDSIGICGATSTPRWLMEKVRERVESLIQNR